MKNSKISNFILEISQVMLVFLGVYSALMCMATSLELTFNRGIFFLIMLIAAVLFYGLFTVLETFRNGKLYGLLGILLFYIALWLRFRSALQYLPIWWCLCRSWAPDICGPMQPTAG